MKSTQLKTLLFLISLSFLFFSANAQRTHTISGYITDVASGEKLIGANIAAPKINKGATSNTYGFFSLTLPEDSVYLAISYIGYQTQYFRLYLAADQTFSFELSEGETLETLEIVAEKQQRIEEKTQMGEMSIPIQQIKALPALLGETDVLKALQLLPGVQSGGEGTSGLYVRGGSPDQNLILLDGVPVYNASHLFGFFSVFNADAIKNVTLTKGGYPARYGGRLSSVLDINMKEGNMKTLKGEGSIGTIFSKLTIEAPIVKDKTSFIISARRTYIDALAGPIFRITAATEGVNANPRLFFYDLNAKINHKIDDKNRLFLSYYGGKDDFGMKLSSNEADEKSVVNIGLNWGNKTSALRWNREWNNRLFSNTALTYSEYKLNNIFSFEQKTAIDTAAIGFKYTSGIRDFGAKMDFDFIPNPNHYIRFGAGLVHHLFSPGISQSSSKIGQISTDTITGNERIAALESSIYLEDDWNITEDFKANIGIHASSFSVNGKNYFSLQPRLGLRYLLPNSTAIKASFTTMTQYLHLLSNEGVGLPTDLWLSSTPDILPEQSWQVSLGIAKTFKDDFEFSIEGYYKSMKNLVSYIEGASFSGSLFGDDGTNWEEKVTQGNGTAYGVEFFLQKKIGKTTGWIGYTWSKTTRQFDDINDGKPYPYKYDRRHDISVVALHEFNEKVSASATWVYGTGNAITLPVSKLQAYSYDITGLSGSLFEATWDLDTQPAMEIEGTAEKNNYRMRAYHRLDISIAFKKDKKKTKFGKELAWERTWAFGAYNTYSRANPFFIARSFDLRGGTEQRFRQYSLFPIIPFVSYQFKF